MPTEPKTQSLNQFGVRHILLCVFCIAIVFAFRVLSIKTENEIWVSYAPLVGAGLLATGCQILGLRNWLAIFAGTFFAFLASIAHSVELISRSPAFSFLRQYKIYLSGDIYFNAIVVGITTAEALLAAVVCVGITWLWMKSRSSVTY